jgi:FMN phosphatase YigB (HAD superfamily)
MIKVVVFDLGKVLVDFDYGIAARRLAQCASRPSAEIYGVIYESPLLTRYESAQISSEQFFREAGGAIGFRGRFEDFSMAFADIFTAIPEMIGLHAELREAGLPTFILSNTNEIAVHHIRRNFPFFSTFSGHVLSYEHGVMKPAPGIYEVAEKMSRCRDDEILFIDDREENVQGAVSRGWKTIRHREPAETVPIVRRLVS